jgi:hypothetical protein
LWNSVFRLQASTSEQNDMPPNTNGNLGHQSRNPQPGPLSVG